MSIKINPTKVVDYFNNIVCSEKAKQLHSFSITRSICHLAVQIEGNVWCIMHQNMIRYIPLDIPYTHVDIQTLPLGIQTDVKSRSNLHVCYIWLLYILESSHPHVLRFLCTCLYPRILISSCSCVLACILASLHPHVFRFICLCLHPCILLSSGSCVLVCILASSHPHILRFICVSLYPRILASSYPQVYARLLVSSHPHILVSSGLCVLVSMFLKGNALKQS